MGRFEEWRTKGVDLRHLLVVLVGVAVLTTVGLPAWFGRPGPTLDSAARLLARDLRAAQNLAVVENRTLHVVFAPDGYRVEDPAGPAVIDPRTGGAFRRRWARDAVFRGVEYRGDELGPEPLGFDPIGYALRGAAIRLGFDEKERLVEVSPRQGLVTVRGGKRVIEDDGR